MFLIRGKNVTINVNYGFQIFFFLYVLFYSIYLNKLDIPFGALSNYKKIFHKQNILHHNKRKNEEYFH